MHLGEGQGALPSSSAQGKFIFCRQRGKECLRMPHGMKGCKLRDTCSPDSMGGKVEAELVCNPG